MTIIGVSVDDVDASRRLAAAEHIGFALVSDADLTVARAYVGADDHDLAVPGVVLIRRDGTIGFRRISGDKADRPTVAGLLAEIDRVLGRPAAAPALRGGYGPTERLQLGGEVGGGALAGGEAGGWQAIAVAGVTGLYPLGRHALVGAAVGGEARTGRVDLELAVAGRVPFYDDLAAIQLTVRGGRSLGAIDGWRAGTRLGLGFAVTPSWAFDLEVGAATLDVGGDVRVEATATLGVTRLIMLR